MLRELQNWLFNQNDKKLIEVRNRLINLVSEEESKHYLIIFIAINIITFFLFGIDKLMASARIRSRLFKRSLIIWSMIGIYGAFLGMLVFSHYIRKMWFIRLLIIFLFYHLHIFILLKGENHNP